MSTLSLHSANLAASKQPNSFLVEDPLVIILLGPPGSGKGTHAGPLSAHFSLPHISTGDLFRFHMNENTDLGKKVRAYINRGALVPDELVLGMLFERLQQEDCNNGYILDGFPRSIAQAKILEQNIQEQALFVAIHLDVSDEIIIERILGRLLCQDCQRSFHRVFCPPTKEGICDSCGGTLAQRSDDNRETIAKRLSAYHQEIAPILSFYRGKGLLRRISAASSKQEIFAITLTTIERFVASKKQVKEEAVKKRVRA